MKRFVLFVLTVVALALASSTVARAEEVYVGNRPFQGPVSGAGLETWVGAAELAKAMGLELKDSGGVWIAGDAPAPEGTPPGSVVFAGKLVQSRVEASGRPMVHLKSAADALGAVVRLNKALGTLDVNRPVARTTPVSSGGGVAGTVPSGPLHLNQGRGGASVDLPGSLVAGVTNVVYFYADF